MINCVKTTSAYNLLNLSKYFSHAYLFYSSDKELNNEIALNFAKSLLCKNGDSCGKCSECNQFDSLSHPDLTIINQDSIKVEDVNKLMPKLATKPISANKKLFVILNFETMNEIAQNKLLKSLEEPNKFNVFIVTSTKMDKILPTILSRLSKFHVPKLSNEDKLLISKELQSKGIAIQPYLNLDSLTEMLNFALNEDYNLTLSAINKLFLNLNTTADIPKVVSELGNINKKIFFSLMQEMFLDCISNTNRFSAEIIAPISLKFSNKALINCLPLIDKAYRMQQSNVNFTYILDNLLFNILKEKFLCK